MARPSTADKTRAHIVQAALALLDAEGLDALSTRRLAHDLGIRGPTLYHYFASKQALLHAVLLLVVDEVWDGVEARLARVAADDWEGTLAGYVRGGLTGMSRHPNAIEPLALRPVSAPRTLTGYELMLGRLTAAGWPLTSAWQVFLAAENLMLSAALEAGAPPFAPAAREIGDLPLVRDVAARIGGEPQLDEGFGVGLEALLAGLRAHRHAPGGG